MSFHSLTYIAFLLVVLSVYWSLRHRAQNWFLIPASLVFYGWVHPWFLLPFAATTLVDYGVARAIESTPQRRRALVALSVCSNLALLGVFKYYNFFIANTAALLDALGLPVSLPTLAIVLPAGISFYTFQSIGYVIDVSRGHVRACRSFRDYALFVAFFPQLVAGPIQRAGHLLTQIQRPRSLRPEVVSDALFLLIWGFFKKVVIADSVAVTAEKVFALQQPSFPILWAGVLAFCIQIYADFSGYTDIARGTARLLGFDLSPNFNHPYLANSPSDFWRRWHISLSSWIRDYLYIPLGGSRGSTGADDGESHHRFHPHRPLARRRLELSALGILLRRPADYLPARGSAGSSRPRESARNSRRQNPPDVRPHQRRLADFPRTKHRPALARLDAAPQRGPDSDWQVAAYLSATTALYTLPLALHAIWDLALRERLARWNPSPALGRCAATVVATILFTAILLLRGNTSQAFIYFQF